jgi:hypothetical protein
MRALYGDRIVNVSWDSLRGNYYEHGKSDNRYNSWDLKFADAYDKLPDDIVNNLPDTVTFATNNFNQATPVGLLQQVATYNDEDKIWLDALIRICAGVAASHDIQNNHQVEWDVDTAADYADEILKHVRMRKELLQIQRQKHDER